MLVNIFMVLWLSVREHSANAYSISWVYEDLVAFPQYKVAISETHLIPNSSLGNIVFDEVYSENGIVPTVARDSTNEDTDPKITSIMMRSAKGQPYVCQMPIVSNQTIMEEKDQEGNQKNADLMKKGLALLEPMEKKDCLYYIQGWWTYEYCHLRHVRQYHQILQPGLPPAEDPNSVNVLGKYDPRLATLPPANKDNNEGQKYPLGTDLQAGKGKRYLIQRWGDGSTCDLTGKPRKVDIQFHCRPQSRDGIAVVKEMHTCHYLVIIHTPRLCHDPAFSKSFQINAIECRPIVSDEKYEHIMTKEQRSLGSGLQEEEPSIKKDEEINKTTEDEYDSGDAQLDSSQDSDEENSDPKKKTDTKAIKLENIANVIASLQEQMRTMGRRDAEGGERNIREHESGQDQKIQIYFMHENGQLEQIDTRENLAKRIKPSDLENDGSVKNKESINDFNGILEAMVANSIKKKAGNSGPKSKEAPLAEDKNSQSHQARLSRLYEHDFESDPDEDPEK